MSYLVCLSQVCIYDGGTFKASLSVEQNNNKIPCDIRHNGQCLENIGYFETTSWNSGDKLPVELKDVSISFESSESSSNAPHVLNASILRSNMADENEVHSYEPVAHGSAILCHNTCLFPVKKAVLSHNQQESQRLQGTLKLLAVRNAGRFQMAYGWIKYTVSYIGMECHAANLGEGASGSALERHATEVSGQRDALAGNKGVPSEPRLNLATAREENKISVHSGKLKIKKSIAKLGGKHTKVTEAVGLDVDVVDSTKSTWPLPSLARAYLTRDKVNKFADRCLSDESALNQDKGASRLQPWHVRKKLHIPQRQNGIYRCLRPVPQTKLRNCEAVASMVASEVNQSTEGGVEISPLPDGRATSPGVLAYKSSVSLTNRSTPSPPTLRVSRPAQEQAKSQLKSALDAEAISSLQEDLRLPEEDAIKKLLPKFHSLATKSPQRSQSVAPHVPIVEPPATLDPTLDSAIHRPLVSEQMGSPSGYSVGTILENQAKELERYRLAVRKMGQDMHSLRKEIIALEHKNSQLKTKLFYACDGVPPGCGKLIDDAAIAEEKDLSNLVVLLKRRLLGEAEENTELRDRLQTLQNKIIKKNEAEERYIRLEKVHADQQELLQQLQRKMCKYKTLEDTCRKQEEVIEELEKRLNSSKAKAKGNGVQAKRGANADQSKNVLVDLNVEDRLLLLQKLERAEARIVVLEEQLLNNTRLWAREKTELQLYANQRLLSDPYRSFRPVSPSMFHYLEPPTRKSYPYDPGGRRSERDYGLVDRKDVLNRYTYNSID